MKTAIRRIIGIALAAILVSSALLPALATEEAPLHNEKDYYDFSEINMATWLSDANTDVYVGGVDDGGNAQLATNYLAAWKGPVNEEADPYPTCYVGGYTPQVKEMDPVLHIKEMLNIAACTDSDFINGTNYAQIRAIKDSLMSYGALYCGILYTDDYIAGYTPEETGVLANLYFPPAVCMEMVVENYSNPDALYAHAVAIVGWDDNYSKENFAVQPKHDGAFICKNSWTTDSGYDGYMYISYEDASCNYFLSDIVAFETAGSDCGYNKIYQYDEYGALVSYKELYDEIDAVANVFPQEGTVLESSEYLKAISFYTTEDYTYYDAYLVTDFTNEKDLLIKSGNPKLQLISQGTIGYSGYHVVDIDQPILLEEGTRYAIVIDFENDLFNEYACEAAVSKYTKANKGESYYISGKKIYDLNDNVYNSNWCVKAFTYYEPESADGVSPDALGNYSFFGIDNENRKYTSNRYYTIDELLETGASINPEYVEYCKNPYDTEIIPSPLEYKKNNSVSKKENASSVQDDFPEEFDLRDHGCVSTVKDQGSFGTCWAHASIAALESNVLMKYGANEDNGIFENTQELGFRENKEVNISSAGEEVVLKFTAPQEGEITFAVSGGEVQAELCSAFGIVFERLENSKLSRYIYEDEDVFLKVRFKDSSKTGKINIFADSSYIPTIFPDAEMQLDEIRSFTLPAEARITVNIMGSGDYTSGFFKVTSEDEIEISDEYGYEVSTNEFYNLYGYSEGNETYIAESLTVSSPKDKAVSFTVEVLSEGEYFTREVVDYSETDGFTSEDEGTVTFRFVPQETGYYTLDFAGDEPYWEFNGIYDENKKPFEYTEENYRNGHYLLEGGKTYYISLYMSPGTVFIRSLWDESPKTEALVLNKKVRDALYSLTDSATYTLTAEQGGAYKLILSGIYEDEYKVTFTDSEGNGIGERFDDFWSTYLYFELDAGETATFKLEFLPLSEEDDYRSVAGKYSITWEKADGTDFVSDFVKYSIETGEKQTFEQEEETEYYFSFVPEEDGKYVINIKPGEVEPDNVYNETYSFFVNSDWESCLKSETGWKGDIYLLSDELSAGEPYYLYVCAQSAIRSFDVSVERYEDVRQTVTETLTPGNPVSYLSFADYTLTEKENAVRVPVKVEALSDNDYFGYEVFITLNGGGSIDIDSEEYYLDCIDETEHGEVYQLVNREDYLPVLIPIDEDFEGVLMITNGKGTVSVDVSKKIAPESDWYEFPSSMNYLEVAFAYVNFADYDGKIIWESSNEEVAVVDENGMITAVGRGPVVITARTEDGTQECGQGIYVKFSWWQWIIYIVFFGFLWY